MSLWRISKDHVIDRINERARILKGLNVMAEFERICENLEDYVPSDWRLTRFTGDFLILDLAIGITLVGDQRRKDMSADIIKVVNTALLAGGFSKAKLGKHAGSAHLFEIAKRPNLFIGNERIHEIFKVSPVLARQYEKVTYKTILIEFEWGTRTRSKQQGSPVSKITLGARGRQEFTNTCINTF